MKIQERFVVQQSYNMHATATCMQSPYLSLDNQSITSYINSEQQLPADDASADLETDPSLSTSLDENPRKVRSTTELQHACNCYLHFVYNMGLVKHLCVSFVHSESTTLQNT